MQYAFIDIHRKTSLWAVWVLFNGRDNFFLNQKNLLNFVLFSLPNCLLSNPHLLSYGKYKQLALYDRHHLGTQRTFPNSTNPFKNFTFTNFGIKFQSHQCHFVLGVVLFLNHCCLTLLVFFWTGPRLDHPDDLLRRRGGFQGVVGHRQVFFSSCLQTARVLPPRSWSNPIQTKKIPLPLVFLSSTTIEFIYHLALDRL